MCKMYEADSTFKKRIREIRFEENRPQRISIIESYLIRSNIGRYKCLQIYLQSLRHIMKISRLIIIFLSIVIARSINFKRQTNSADPKAICLNGAQSFIYTQSQPIASPSGIIIYFMPTPTPIFCGGNTLPNSLDKCVTAYDEVNTYWTSDLNITSGILSDPAYQNWVIVIMPSCDGSLFQGYATNTTQYKGRNLTFRGNRIIKSNLQYISKKYNFTKINNFVFAGNGFGANGALIWSRYFYDEFVFTTDQRNHFSLILDSIPFGYSSFKSKANQYETSLQNLLKIVNVQELNPFILCTLRNEGQEWRCFKLEQSYYYLNFPILLIDSQYDQTSISTILQIDCINKQSGSLNQCSTSQRQYIQGYRSSKMLKYYELVNFHDNSVWTISCSSNSFLNNGKYENESWRVDESVKDSVNSFVSRSRITSINYNEWPSNQACSGQN